MWAIILLWYMLMHLLATVGVLLWAQRQLRLYHHEMEYPRETIFFHVVWGGMSIWWMASTISMWGYPENTWRIRKWIIEILENSSNEKRLFASLYRSCKVTVIHIMSSNIESFIAEVLQSSRGCRMKLASSTYSLIWTVNWITE